MSGIGLMVVGDPGMMGFERRQTVHNRITSPNGGREDRKAIKCVVWDLDDTLWDGILLEDQAVFLRDGVTEIIKTLDARGVLQSIASKNNYDQAMAKLCELGLHEYFLYPQINWNSKAASIQTIAGAMNVGLDAIALIDDQPFELAEVTYSLPEVLCIDAKDLDRLLEIPEMNPRFITEDSSKRRLMYLNDLERKKAEEQFVGPQEAFLSTLKMVFTISSAKEDDLKRAEELTIRTNQLNTTGYTYSYEDLNQFRESGQYKLLIASLDDLYGSYGKIGLALIECEPEVWTIKLLLMSCRVMSRGVGMIMLNYILRLAKEQSVCLRAEFIPTDRNRMMYITYKFAGFKEIQKSNDLILLAHELTSTQSFPEYVEVQII